MEQVWTDLERFCREEDPADQFSWSPLPGPQTRALETEADELLYGGAAGGGKTDLLIGLSLTRHQKAIIFRREYPQLKDIIARSRDIAGDYGKFNANDNLWRFPDGRTLEFGAVQHEEDKRKYKGRAHDLKAFDELTEFTEAQYRFLIAWNRTAKPNQRCRVVGASNPPTSAEGEWVIQYWGPWLDPAHPHPAEPGELRWYAVVDGEDQACESGKPFDHKGETITPRSRTFIPARVQDNPHLIASGYVATLQNVPEPLRSQLLFGDFAAGTEDDPWQVIPTGWVRAAQARWKEDGKPAVSLSCLGVDVARGGKDRTVLARRYANWYAPLEVHLGSATPDGPSVAALVLKALGETRAACHLDAISVGTSPLDILRENRVPVKGINVANASTATDRTGQYPLRNLRTEGYWKLREALDPENGENLSLPPDRELLAELCAHRWKLTTAGIAVEPKEEVIERIGRSPDKAEAVMLAHLYAGAGGVRLVKRPTPPRSAW